MNDFQHLLSVLKFKNIFLNQNRYLADCLFVGDGVKKNEAEAMQWYAKARVHIESLYSSEDSPLYDFIFKTN